MALVAVCMTACGAGAGARLDARGASAAPMAEDAGGAPVPAIDAAPLTGGAAGGGGVDGGGGSAPRPDAPGDAHPADAARVVDAGGVATDARVDPKAALTGPVLFMDRFAAGDLTGWMPATGAWSLCAAGGAQAYCQGGAAKAVSLVGDPGWTDYEIKFTVTLDDPMGWVELVFRAQSPDRYYAFQAGNVYGKGGMDWQAIVYNAGRAGHVGGGGFPFQPGAPFPMHVRVKGNGVTVYWSSDKGKTFNATNTIYINSMPPAGRVGVGSSGSKIEVSGFTVTGLL